MQLVSSHFLGGVQGGGWGSENLSIAELSSKSLLTAGCCSRWLLDKRRSSEVSAA